MDPKLKDQYLKSFEKIFRPNDVYIDILLGDGPGKYGSIIRKTLEDMIKFSRDEYKKTSVMSNGRLITIFQYMINDSHISNIEEFIFYMEKNEDINISPNSDNTGENFIANVWPLIKKTLSDLNLEYHYFSVFNMKLNQCKVGWNDNYKLTPELFETATCLFNMDIYDSSIKTIESGSITGSKKEKFTSLKGIGWHKYDLFNAIKNTGLNIPQETEKFKTNKKRDENEDKRIYKKRDEKGEKKEIMKSPLAEMFNYPGSKLPGINTKNEPYMGRWYYEAIYRKLFNTLKYIDWNAVKVNKLLTLDQILKIMIDEFGFNYDWIKNYNYETLCDLLTKEIKDSEIRKVLREESKNILKEEIPLLQPQILYQPGSLIVSHLTQGTQNLMTPILGPQKEINLIYGDIYNLCSNFNTTKEEIYFKAVEKGLNDILNINQSKEEMCKTLIKYIETTQINYFK